MIVQRLLALQEEQGFIRDAQLAAVAREAGVPLYRVQELVSFFSHFRREWDKPRRVEIKVCRDMTCHLRGARTLLSDKGLGRLAKAGEVTIDEVSCLGRCDRAPVCVVSRNPDDRAESAFHDFVYAGRSLNQLHEFVADVIAGKTPPTPDTDAAHVCAGNQDEWQIDVYRDGERSYRAVRQFLQEFPTPIRGRDPKDHPWLARLDPAGLLGMGGAGVPAYRKWLDVWQAVGDEKYIVCNGDESEPGTFKDREILLRLPHLVVEGVVLAGLMTNATAGYIFIRHEYGEQIDAIRREIDRALELRACGNNIFGSGRSFPVEVVVSPGGYICGEQSALLEAMEDRRAQPRNRPPELSTNGLRDRPTLVNNVETLAWAPAILLRHDVASEQAERAKLQGKDTAEASRRAALSASWYAQAGRPGFRGRRLFSVSGDLERPGVYEIPIGMSLGELIQLAGGVRGGRGLGAVAPSGPSGGLLPPTLPAAEGWQQRLAKKPDDSPAEQWDALDQCIRSGMEMGAGRFDIRALPLDLGLFRLVGPALGLRVGLMLGAGIVVYAEGMNILEQAVNFTEFFRNESCGKCVPCRLGSQKLVDLGTSLLAGPVNREAVRKDVFDLAYALNLTSICGLGVVASNPLATALDLFDTR